MNRRRRAGHRAGLETTARLVRRHRRPLAALLLAGATALTVQHLTPAPPGISVTVAAADLAAGRTIESGDLRTAQVDADAVASGGLDAEDLLGARLRSPVRAGEQISDLRLGELTAGLRPGRVALAVPDSGLGTWLRVGSTVDVLLAGVERSELVARGATVLDLAGESEAGLLDSASSQPSRVLLSVSESDARRIAAAPLDSTLVLALTG